MNSNPATIMTDPAMADATYIEPVTWQTVEQIIEKERPDAAAANHGWSDRAELRPGSGNVTACWKNTAWRLIGANERRH
ncbi:MAG: hypothetical protein ACFHHU_14335 [Porticoccaceae bacterium]